MHNKLWKCIKNVLIKLKIEKEYAFTPILKTVKYYIYNMLHLNQSISNIYVCV